MDFLVCTANSDTMGINRMTTVSAKIGMPRIKELRAMAHHVLLSNQLNGPFSNTHSRACFLQDSAHGASKEDDDCHAFDGSEKPLFMVPQSQPMGFPVQLPVSGAAIRIPIAALTLHLEMRKIINRITSAKTISTYDVDIKPTLPNLYFTAGFLFNQIILT